MHLFVCVNDMYDINILPLYNQEPSITEIKPDYGPVFGGTMVTLTGRYLNSGMKIDVLFADKKCTIQR